jgi:hypothetical protein
MENLGDSYTFPLRCDPAATAYRPGFLPCPLFVCLLVYVISCYVIYAFRHCIAWTSLVLWWHFPFAAGKGNNVLITSLHIHMVKELNRKN